MNIKRVFFGLAALLLAGSTLAATVADRSPFAQGVWWNPARNGDGFKIFNAAGQVMVVWYTYDDAERPTWYTAQGELTTMGQQSWPLMKHRWANGRKAEATQVGTLRLSVRHPEAADLVWEIRGRQGTWPIQPFIVSGVVSEVDHTGLWFDPANSGWGFALTDQGDVMGGLLFTYDAAGEPIWAAGFDRGKPGRVELHTFTGACTACPHRAPISRSVGHLSFDFRGDMDLTVFNELTLPMAAGVNVGGARLANLSRPASWRPADRQLASFHSEAALKAYLDAGMQNIPPSFAAGDFSAAPPAAAYSPTNLVESGVDEADLVKSNGRHVYTYAYANGARQPALRIAQIANDGASFGTRGLVSLQSGSTTPMSTAGLYLEGDNLVSVTGTQPGYYDFSAGMPPMGAWARGVTHVEVLSTSNPDLPVTRWRAEIDGHIVSSRRIGQRLYVVSRYVPHLPGFTFGTTYAPAVTANQQILASTSLSGLLPQVRVAGGGPVPLVGAAEVFAPPQGSRKPMANMVLVTAIDLAAPRIAQALAVIGDVDAIYASSTSLFVANSRYEIRALNGALLPSQPSFPLTDVHQIRIGPEAMSIVGSGSLEGILSADLEKAAFRLSEHQGRLRAVTTTSTGMWGGGISNRVTIMEPSALTPGLLKTVSWLPNAARPQTLGKPFESLYGTRFVGDRLYAVTFRRIDPLYVVDLADATDPKIAGALEVPGFSEYLHPLANGMLLGFGLDTTSNGMIQGLQMSLYDVADAGKPRELQRVLIGKAGSDSALLRDHHALSALPRPDGSLSMAFPARVMEPTEHRSGLLRYELRGSGPSDARLVEGAHLITHQAAAGSPTWYLDHVGNGRSVLLRNGAVFIAGGQFWHQDSNGNATGPY